MKKILLLFVFTVSTIKAQDIVTIENKNYTTKFSKTLKYPIVVEWWETTKKSMCDDRLKRKNNFSPDPKLSEYTNLNNDYINGNRRLRKLGKRGLDRGHMSPARVNQCQDSNIQDESFYFSNIAPQYHALNGGDWKILETYTYNTSIEKDSVHVWAGSVGSIGKIGDVTIPKKCWKVIYVVKTKEWSAYLFNNDTSKSNGIEDNKVDIKVIEKLTGLKFK